MYNLKIKLGGNQINFTDWQKETVDFLKEHKNIKKVWLVNKQRKTGATYFSKLLMYFRPPCDKTFVISNNLNWSDFVNRHMTISFWINPIKSKDGEWHKVSRFLTPVTLFGLEQKVNKVKLYYNKLYETFKSDNKNTPSFECLYDNEFNVEKYNVLCSYNFDFFIINVRPEDLEKAKPFIEADKDKDDVLIVNVENTLFPEYFNSLKTLGN